MVQNLTLDQKEDISRAPGKIWIRFVDHILFQCQFLDFGNYTTFKKMAFTENKYLEV